MSLGQVPEEDAVAMTINEYQEHAKELARAFPDATVEHRLLFLVAEVGELTREVLHLRGAYASRGKPDAGEATERVGLEMYDVFWNLCDLANMLGVDLEQCFAKKIDVNRQRSW